MNSRIQRDFFRQVEKMNREEREARLRWIEHTVAKRVELGGELLIRLDTLRAMLTCRREKIPVQFWRPPVP